MIDKHTLTTEKTARYFTYGQFSEKTKYIWFVLHGYGQTASYFLKKFHFLNPEEHFIIAPEGLHRFYWEGFSGKVVASWMTKEDREDDIKDYIFWLNLVYEKAILPIKLPHQKIITLGFSQGTATLSRWIGATVHKPDAIVWYAGLLPSDMDWKLGKEKLTTIPSFILIGNKDEYVTTENVNQVQEVLKAHEIKCSILEFDGGHEIKEEALDKLIMNYQLGIKN